MKPIQAFLLALLGLMSAGCDTDHFLAETRLQTDGSLERVVYLPLAQVPEAVQKSAVWQERRNLSRVTSVEQHQHPLSDLIRRPELGSTLSKDKPLYWVASGKFPDVSAIPDYLSFEAPAEMPAGHLERRLQRRDAGLVIEWVWDETLTEIITLSDQRLARDSAAEIALGIHLPACAEAWGPEYDLQNFERWLRQDVVQCCQELCDLYLETRLNKHRRASDQEELYKQAAKILQRYGLNLFDAKLQLIKDNKVLTERLKAFVNENLQRYVRDKQDRPLSLELRRDALQTLFPEERDNEELPEEGAETRLAQAITRATLARFGTEEKFQEATERLAARIFGLYGFPFLAPRRQFAYRMEFPGVILQTNGTLIGDRTICWKFDAAEAYPLGYQMHAVAVEINTSAVAKYFPRATLENREHLAELLDFIAADETLRAALSELVSKDDHTAWKQWKLEHLDASRVVTILETARDAETPGK